MSLIIRKAMISDEMTDSISYADIAEVVVKTATTNTFNLLERLDWRNFKKYFYWILSNRKYKFKN